MDLNVTARNPNDKIGQYYHKMEWDLYYEDERTASSYMAPFHQGPKTTTVLQPVLIGNEYAILREEIARVVEALDRPLELGLKLQFNVRFKVGICKSWKFKMGVECHHIYIAQKYTDQRFKIRVSDNHGDNSFDKRIRCTLLL